MASMQGTDRNFRRYWWHVTGYGVLLCAGTLVLEWLDYGHFARTRSGDVYVFVVAAGFLALGIYVGARVIAPRPPEPFDGNPAARAALGISPRELTVLEEIAAGHSNKEIAARLRLSPDTVKSHLSRLYEKLGAKRRTDAINRARELGIVR